MRLHNLLFVLTCVANISLAQPVEMNHPQILESPSTSFSVRLSRTGDTVPLLIGKRDTVDLGTDGAPGSYAVVHYGGDSLRIDNFNFPYFQVHYIPIRHQDRTIIYRLHFNEVFGSFSQDYMKANLGNVQVEIPEVYELANILLLLSPAGQRAANMDKKGDYYDKVTAYFKAYINHPVFANLNFADSVFYKNYYDFRENSFCYRFENDKIVRPGPYYYVMGTDNDYFSSLFSRLVPEIEDFARVSKFRDFYRANAELYKQLVAREKQLLPVRNMWTWVEKQFPKKKFHSYKIVFSPIIGATHSTQNFTTRYNSGWFLETVMFVCGPAIYDRNTKLSEKQKEGLLSGIVFTEIDHNYVNPVSENYEIRLDSIFADRAIWTAARGDNQFYGSPMSIFNEYMTHGLFSLYVLDTFDPETADFLIRNRENLMVDQRGFSRFRDFNSALILLRKQNKEATAENLYPLILDWCRQQI